jgi:hypothetical protein
VAGSVGRWAAVPVSTQLDPRVLQLSSDAELFYLRAWLYVGEHTTDGVIPDSAHALLGMKLATSPAELIEELTSTGLLRRRHDADLIVDYLDLNPTAAQVKKRSEHGRKAAIAKWAKVKAEEQDAQEEDPASDGDSASGSADGIASGIDGQSNEEADGNAPHGTGRDGTYVEDGCTGGSLSSVVDDDDNDGGSIPYSSREGTSSPPRNRNGDGPARLGDSLTAYTRAAPA